jgi:hypothetical protein
MRIIQNCKGNILLATYNGKIIGQLDYVFSDDHDQSFFTRIQIIWLLIDQNYRNLGIAKYLISSLKERYPDIEIWVEAEDNRSLSLYNSIGLKKKHLDNWVLKRDRFKFDNMSKPGIKEFKSISFKSLLELISDNKIKLLIGKYFAPFFDIQQMLHSDEVHEFLWGNTEKPQIRSYQIHDLQVYIIMTQYLRVYVNITNVEQDDLIAILHDGIAKTFTIGFDDIMVQVYKEDNLNAILTEVGFTIESESDPIFKL